MNRITRGLTAACLLLGGYLSMPALAHNDATTREVAQPSVRSPAESEQPSRTDAVGKEAGEVKVWCYKRRAVSIKHDCECVTDRFIVERQADPVSGKDTLLSRILTVNKCPNLEGIRATKYKECIVGSGSPGFNTGGHEVEAYCQCVGKRTAKSISGHKGKLGSGRRGSYGRNALAYCSKAEAYR